MNTSLPKTILRSDYRPSPWQIIHTRLLFELDAHRTRVTSHLKLRKHDEGSLELDGVGLKLLSVQLDSKPLAESQYTVTEKQLIVDSLPAECVLSIVVEIDPESNKALEGLYLSSANFCTQCEAEGFRKITYYLDRPDVLSTFDVSISADAKRYPVLLSNGNFVSSEMHDDGRHSAHWHDPYPKPAYIFALVAGELSHIEDEFVTASGRKVKLLIYVQAHNIDACSLAMDALKRSMRWDEEVYGLEYDLDLFMIVAVDDFNMGAMENKGLNIFNSKYVLANQDTATDADILGVEAVIAHEYFHNWTGNRVTCRDWFQLSLKEGLTVFRDQQFSADMHSPEVKRIEDVRLLRSAQFPEDASPLSHPIRPDSYIEINNFYTLTVYEKGAEVIRMMHTLLGSDHYYSGVDLFLKRHDGEAATCDDFISAMQEASGVDLSQFQLWYSQAGTPTLKITDSFDETKGEYTLNIEQKIPDTPGQKNKKAMQIPLRIGLINSKGQMEAVSLGRKEGDGAVLDVTAKQQKFVFSGLTSKPVPSLLRGFSAPVHVEYDYSDKTLCFLLAHDTDSFNRWEAVQRLYTHVINRFMLGEREDAAVDLLPAIGSVIRDKGMNARFKAELLSIPSIETLASNADVIDIHAMHRARKKLISCLATEFQSELEVLASRNDAEADKRSNVNAGAGADMNRRSLANKALMLLTELEEVVWLPIAKEKFDYADNMTDSMAALSALCCSNTQASQDSLNTFYKRWESNKLVIDKWFAVQAGAEHELVFENVKALMQHPAFDRDNPNRFRSLLGRFAMGNPAYFHVADGAPYTLITDQIMLLDKTNPQVAARLVTPFLQWRKFVAPQKEHMQAALQRIAAVDTLSPDVFEVVSKALSESV